MFTSHHLESPSALNRPPARRALELPLGAHVTTPRRRYTHHGIYAGHGIVIHYAGFSRSWQAGPVEELTLAEFAQGRPLGIVDHPRTPYTAQQIVDRARTRLGEQHYDLLRNNCEHFCNECINAMHRSAQAERFGRLSSWLLDRAVALISRPLPRGYSSVMPVQ
jgi:hypothetical protein